jgi:hypothetical protein
MFEKVNHQGQVGKTLEQTPESVVHHHYLAPMQINQPITIRGGTSEQRIQSDLIFEGYNCTKWEILFKVTLFIREASTNLKFGTCTNSIRIT